MNEFYSTRKEKHGKKTGIRVNLKNNTYFYITSAYILSKWQVKSYDFRKRKTFWAQTKLRKNFWTKFCRTKSSLVSRTKKSDTLEIIFAIMASSKVFFCVFLLVYLLKKLRVTVTLTTTSSLEFILKRVIFLK